MYSKLYISIWFLIMFIVDLIFTMKCSYKKKYKKVLLFITFIVPVIYIAFLYFFMPVQIGFCSLDIETPDRENPRTKILEYEIYVNNMSNRHVDFVLYIKKDKDAESWFPYYKTIPETHVSEVFHLEPYEHKILITKVTVQNNDERTVNTLFTSIKVKCKLVNEIKNDSKGIPDKNLYQQLKFILGKEKLYAVDFKDVTNLLLIDKQIANLKGLDKLNLSSVESIYIHKNKIESLEPLNSKKLINLKELKILGSNIKSIDKKTFSKLINLEKISVNCNEDIKIDKNSFKNLKKLSCLSLSDNNLREIELTGIDSLRELDLSRNKFISINDIKINNLSSLEVLWICDSVNFDLEKNMLSGLKNVKRIDLSENAIDNIRNNAFSEMKNLEYVNLSNSFIENIEENAFYGLDKLSELSLMNNNLSKLSLSEIENLKYLSLWDNEIKKFRDVSFSSFPFLNYIDMGSNLISEISMDDFSDIKNVKTLNLCENNIEQIPDGVFRNLESTENLFLGGNKISSLNKNSFSEMNKLKYLDLNFNSFEKIDSNTFEHLNTLEYLNLSHCGLKNLPYLKNNVKLNRLEKMEEIYYVTDFSDNYLTEEIFANCLPENLLADKKWLDNQYANQWKMEQIESQRKDPGVNCINAFKQIISIDNYSSFINGDYEKLSENLRGYFTDRGLQVLFFNRIMCNNYNYILKNNITNCENINVELFRKYMYQSIEYVDLKVSYTYVDKDKKKHELTDYYKLNIDDKYIDYIMLDMGKSSIGKDKYNAFIFGAEGKSEWIEVIYDLEFLKALRERTHDGTDKTMSSAIDSLYSYVAKLDNIKVQLNEYNILTDEHSKKIYQYDLDADECGYRFLQLKVIQPYAKGEGGIWTVSEYRLIK